MDRRSEDIKAMAHDVFISYSGLNRQIGLAVCHALEQSGIRCWIAPRDIKSGENISDSIDRAIMECKIFLLLFSDHAQQSKWIRGEVNVAFDAQKLILPIRIDQTKTEGPLRVMLIGSHWLDAYPNPEERFGDIIHIVQGIIRDGNDYNWGIENRAQEQIKSRGWVKKLFGSNSFKVVCNSDCMVYIDAKQWGILRKDKCETMKFTADAMTIEAVSETYPNAHFSKTIYADHYAGSKLYIDLAESERNYLLTMAGEGKAAQLNDMGNIYYEDGKIDQALQYYIKAANRGESAAAYNIGKIYHYGEGGEQNYEIALEYYTQAIENRFPLAQSNMGSMYYHGEGVEKDLLKAYSLFVEAAEQGVCEAQLIIADMLIFGIGVEPDHRKAKRWLKIASDNGHEISKSLLNSWRDDPETGLTYIEISLNDNSRYEGFINDRGLRTGFGKRRYADGDQYEGEWKENVRHGNGIAYFANGDKHEGAWVDDVAIGECVYTYADGDRYEGRIENSKKNGDGTLYFTDGSTYKGLWNNDILQIGSGYSRYSSGDSYEGEIRDNMRHGHGIYRYSDGDSYEGEWQADQEQGHGIFRHADGRRFEGEFKDGKRNGQGVLYFCNGDKCVATWVDGNMNGNGIFYSHHGHRYEGGYKNGKKHGNGTLYSNDGTIEHGVWDNGNRIR